MDKKHSNLGLHSGPPRYTSEEAVREQLRQAPKLSGPSIAARLVQRGKAAEVAQAGQSTAAFQMCALDQCADASKQR